jgi:hypothetical protein
MSYFYIFFLPSFASKVFDVETYLISYIDGSEYSKTALKHVIFLIQVILGCRFDMLLQDFKKQIQCA